LVATHANADLALNDRDWASEARAAASVGFWEQANQVEELLRDGKPGEARELLASMQTRMQALQQRVDALAKTAQTGTIRPTASW
jgi:hypothetical protein